LFIALADHTEKMVNQIRAGNEEHCELFIEVLHELERKFPAVIAHQLVRVVAGLEIVKDRLKWRRLFETAQTLIRFYPEAGLNLSTESLQRICESDVAVPESLTLLRLFPNQANESSLAAACVELYLKIGFDENCEMLLDFIVKGLEIGEVTIPSEQVICQR
jgi:hypothetical protein